MRATHNFFISTDTKKNSLQRKKNQTVQQRTSNMVPRCVRVKVWFHEGRQHCRSCSDVACGATKNEKQSWAMYSFLRQDLPPFVLPTIPSNRTKEKENTNPALLYRSTVHSSISCCYFRRQPYSPSSGQSLCLVRGSVSMSPEIVSVGVVGTLVKFRWCLVFNASRS